MMHRIIVGFVFCLAFGFINPARAEEFTVSSVDALAQAVFRANNNGQADLIVIAPGRYNLPSRLVLTEANTRIVGATGLAADVVISGRGMVKSNTTEVLFDVHADNISVSGLTLQNVANHLIQVRAEKDADNFKLSNSVLRDSFEQMLKVSGTKHSPHYADNGRIENCVFQYTNGIGPQYYIGGVDAHKSRNWIIQHNRFDSIASPGKHIAEHAIHVWNDSSGTQVLNNVFFNNDRGVGFGLGDQAKQHSGGLIKDNVFIHLANHHEYADVSIGLESAPGARVIGNTIYQHTRYANAIEYRFKRTKNVEIRANKVNKRITSRNGGQAKVADNLKLRND